MPRALDHPPLGVPGLDLTDVPVVGPLIPEPRRRRDGRGRPRRDRREVVNGILWILRTGAQWADLPERYPPYQTCHRYFQQWCRETEHRRRPLARRRTWTSRARARARPEGIADMESS
ncbi:MAG: transposase, partial [Gemmatimonadetes bacterium]|nr:transposase [Gemmatimonadota bacterium]